MELYRSIPSFLSGKAQPASASDSAALAQVFHDKQLHGASARFWEVAFKSQPSIADELTSYNRYNAACAAALAGCGQGKDDPPLDGTTKARWRKQALDWLRADLAAWSKAVADHTSTSRDYAPQTLQHWKADPDLAALRDPAALAKLPEDEQKACRALWSDVDALLAKITAKSSP